MSRTAVTTHRHHSTSHSGCYGKCNIAEYERLAAPKPALPLVAFLEGLHLEGLDLARERDLGRDIDL